MKDREDERESERGKEGLSESERGRLFEKERERERISSTFEQDVTT